MRTSLGGVTLADITPPSLLPVGFSLQPVFLSTRRPFPGGEAVKGHHLLTVSQADNGDAGSVFLNLESAVITPGAMSPIIFSVRSPTSDSRRQFDAAPRLLVLSLLRRSEEAMSRGETLSGIHSIRRVSSLPPRNAISRHNALLTLAVASIQYLAQLDCNVPREAAIENAALAQLVNLLRSTEEGWSCSIGDLPGGFCAGATAPQDWTLLDNFDPLVFRRLNDSGVLLKQSDSATAAHALLDDERSGLKHCEEPAP